ncbi:MAG: transcription antitermination factor NusB [Pseudomonadota bacterium]
MSKGEPSVGRQRRQARIAAVQALYQIELNDGSAGAVVDEFATYRLHGEDGKARADTALFADLVNGCTTRQGEVDSLVADALDKDRKLERLEILMRAILRAGTYELLARDDIDDALTISEYVGVADAFFNEREPALVNAVLDRVARGLAGRDTTAEAAHGVTQDG